MGEKIPRISALQIHVVPVLFHLSPNCLAALIQMWSPNCLPLVFHLAPNLSQVSPRCLPMCGFSSVVSQLPPRSFHLSSSCLPLVSQICSPTFIQMWFLFHLSPGCLQGFYTCCLVFHLSPECLSFFSRARFPRRCLPALLLFSCLPPLPDVASQLSTRCLAVVVSQMLPPRILRLFAICLRPVSSTCLSDVVSQLSPTCLPVYSKVFWSVV